MKNQSSNNINYLLVKLEMLDSVKDYAYSMYLLPLPLSLLFLNLFTLIGRNV
jgi:hypothetical protein